METVKRDLATLRNTSTEVQSRLEQEQSLLNDETLQLKTKLKEKSRALTDLESQFEKFKDVHANLNATHAKEKFESEEKIEKLKDSHKEELKTLMASQEEKLGKLNGSHEEKIFKLQALNAELDILKEAYTKVRKGLKQKEDNYDASRQELNNKCQLLDELRDTLGKMESS